jgi:hypothetical protein
MRTSSNDIGCKINQFSPHFPTFPHIIFKNILLNFLKTLQLPNFKQLRLFVIGGEFCLLAA